MRALVLRMCTHVITVVQHPSLMSNPTSMCFLSLTTKIDLSQRANEENNQICGPKHKTMQCLSEIGGLPANG